MPVISMKQLLEAGVHFGHQSNKWNPKMKKYIFTTRNDIHIINLEDTSVLCDKAYYFIRDMVASGKNVLFVGTKKQAQEAIEQDAKRCGMFYIVNRWLGGTLTNFKTIKTRIARLNKLNQMEQVGEFDLLPKKEHIAVKEARALGIAIVGIVDTNCDPDDVDYPIPANDDAIRAVKLIVSAMADAVIEAKEGVTLRNVEETTEDGEKAEINLAEAINNEVSNDEEAK